MEYEKTIWKDKTTLVDAKKLNNIENTLEKSIKEINKVNETLKSISELRNEIDLKILELKNMTEKLQKSIDGINIPVTSVNSKTGNVYLKAKDINCENGSSVENKMQEFVKKQNIEIYEATLENGWVGKLLCFKDNSNVVHIISETLSNGDTKRNTVLTTLPQQFRPSTDMPMSIRGAIFYGSSANENKLGPGSVRIGRYDNKLILDSDVGNYININFSYLSN